MEYVHFFDTTMRAGELDADFETTLEQKLATLQLLDAQNLDTIEIGAVQDERARALFARAAELSPQTCIAAISRLRQEDVVQTIEMLRPFRRARINLICIGSEHHLRRTLRISDETLDKWTATIVSTIHTNDFAGDVLVTLEDASRASPDWLDCRLRALGGAGVRDVCIADSTGCMTPRQVQQLFKRVQKRHPYIRFSARFHNDLGLAAANSLAALDAGVKELQVTFAGIGARCGNAAIEELIGALELTPLYQHYITRLRLTSVLQTCDRILSIVGAQPGTKKPLLGRHAVSTRSSIEYDGTLRVPHVYELLDPMGMGLRQAQQGDHRPSTASEV
jgi:2-isopropylmalate synthase